MDCCPRPAPERRVSPTPSSLSYFVILSLSYLSYLHHFFVTWPVVSEVFLIWRCSHACVLSITLRASVCHDTSPWALPRRNRGGAFTDAVYSKKWKSHNACHILRARSPSISGRWNDAINGINSCCAVIPHLHPTVAFVNQSSSSPSPRSPFLLRSHHWPLLAPLATPLVPLSCSDPKVCTVSTIVRRQLKLGLL
jgi:hypothetical protein